MFVVRFWLIPLYILIGVLWMALNHRDVCFDSGNNHGELAYSLTQSNVLLNTYSYIYKGAFSIKYY